MKIPKKELGHVEKRAIEIFKEICPTWEGTVMLFPYEPIEPNSKVGKRYVVISGEKIFKIIKKAVKDTSL